MSTTPIQDGITMLTDSQHSTLYRDVLTHVADQPGPAIEIAAELDRDIHMVSHALQELQDCHLVGVRNHPEPDYKREYVVTMHGKRLLDRDELAEPEQPVQARAEAVQSPSQPVSE
jgi:DNA-binding MarR family transcriptional regulator